MHAHTTATSYCFIQWAQSKKRGLSNFVSIVNNCRSSSNLGISAVVMESEEFVQMNGKEINKKSSFQGTRKQKANTAVIYYCNLAFVSNPIIRFVELRSFSVSGCNVENLWTLGRLCSLLGPSTGGIYEGLPNGYENNVHSHDCGDDSWAGVITGMLVSHLQIQSTLYETKNTDPDGISI